MGYIINNGIPYCVGGNTGGGVDEYFAFITGDRTASSINDFCLAIAKEFLDTKKPHGFINVVWTNNDYFTGTISRYGTGSAQLIMGRASQNTIVKAKSNGATVTVYTK